MREDHAEPVDADRGGHHESALRALLTEIELILDRDAYTIDHAARDALDGAANRARAMFRHGQ